MKQSPLHKAAHKGDLDTLIRLIDDGADVNARDKYGCSPLMVASLQGHADVARYLLDHGADLHAVDHLGQSAIHQAAIRGSEIVRPRLRFAARRWSTVFPLGMYAVCSFAVGGRLVDFARAWVWVALAAWAIATAGTVRRLA